MEAPERARSMAARATRPWEQAEGSSASASTSGAQAPAPTPTGDYPYQQKNAIAISEMGPPPTRRGARGWSATGPRTARGGDA